MENEYNFFVSKHPAFIFLLTVALTFIISCNEETPNPKDRDNGLNVDGYWSGSYQRRQTFDTTPRPIGVVFKDNDSAVYYNLSPTLDTTDAINKYSIKYLIRNDSLFMNIDEQPDLRYTQYFGRIDTTNNRIGGFFNKIDVSGAIPSAATIFNGNFNLQKN